MEWFHLSAAEIKLGPTDAPTELYLQLHDLVIGCFEKVSKSFLEYIEFMHGSYVITLLVRQRVGVVILITHVSLIMLWLNQNMKKIK